MDSAYASNTEPPTGSGQPHDTTENPENLTPPFPGSDSGFTLVNNPRDILNLDSQKTVESSVDDGKLVDNSKDNNDNCDESFKANNHKELPTADEKESVSNIVEENDVSDSSTGDNGRDRVSELNGSALVTRSEEEHIIQDGANSNNKQESTSTGNNQVIPILDKPSQLTTIIFKDNTETKAVNERQGDHEDIQILQNSSTTLPKVNAPDVGSNNIDVNSNGHEQTLHSSETRNNEVNKYNLPETTRNSNKSAQDDGHVSGAVSSTEITDQDLQATGNATFDSNLASALTSNSNTASAPVKKVPYPVSTSRDVCPFSEQLVHSTGAKDLTPEIHNEDTSTKMEVAKTSAADHFVSRADLTGANVFADTRNKPPFSLEDDVAECSNISSTDDRNRQDTSGSIRNMFPKVTSGWASVGNERSCSVTSDNKVEDEDKAGDKVTDQHEDGDIVLVTGGCGFLGQHIVKLLHLRAPHVAEIRVLDLTFFENKLDYQTTKRMKSMMGDISNAEFVNKALKGVNSVIHVAGIVSWGTFPDFEGMERVNVKGTLNVLNACLKNNVQRLVYCSTVDVAVGNKPIRGGTEDDTPVPDKFLFPGYPETKYHGERIVMGLGKHKRHDGGELQTVILRPNVLYGELDKYYVTNALHMAKQSLGILYKIGNGKAMFQQAYVGNAAWAFVCADTAMKANPALTKEIFYIPDNTPVQNSFNFMLPYLEVHGFKLSNGYLSYALSHSAVAAAELLAKALSPLMKLNLPVQSCTIAYINTDLYFRGDKAKALLNYEPIYMPNEAREMSMKYYANIDLEDKPFRGRNREHT